MGWHCYHGNCLLVGRHRHWLAVITHTTLKGSCGGSTAGTAAQRKILADSCTSCTLRDREGVLAKGLVAQTPSADALYWAQPHRRGQLVPVSPGVRLQRLRGTLSELHRLAVFLPALLGKFTVGNPGTCMGSEWHPVLYLQIRFATARLGSRCWLADPDI